MERNSNSVELKNICTMYNQRVLHIRTRLCIDREIETSYDDTMMAIT